MNKIIKYIIINYNNQMGNERLKGIKSSVIKKAHNMNRLASKIDLPKNNQDIIKDIIQLNNLLSKHVDALFVQLYLQPTSLCKNMHKWKESTVQAILSIQIIDNSNTASKTLSLSQSSQKQQKCQFIMSNNPKQQQQRPQQISPNRQQQSLELDAKIRPVHKQYQLLLTVSNIDQIKSLLQCYELQKLQFDKKRRQSDGTLCVICLQNTPEQMLPCAHSYCSKCMYKFIINKDNQCPMCRKKYQQNLQNNLFSIIQLDLDFVIQMRNTFFSILSIHNLSTVLQIQQLISYKQTT